MILLIPYINLLNLSLIIKCLFLKIMEPLNTFSSEISWPISTKVHVHPAVEMGLRVCSNSHTPLTIMPIYGKIMIIKKKQKLKT